MGVPCILYFFRTKWTYWACSFYVKTYKLETIASFFALGLKDKNGSLITWLEGTQDITYTIKNDDEDLKELAILRCQKFTDVKVLLIRKRLFDCKIEIEDSEKIKEQLFNTRLVLKVAVAQLSIVHYYS